MRNKISTSLRHDRSFSPKSQCFRGRPWESLCLAWPKQHHRAGGNRQGSTDEYCYSLPSTLSCFNCVMCSLPKTAGVKVVESRLDSKARIWVVKHPWRQHATGALHSTGGRTTFLVFLHQTGVLAGPTQLPSDPLQSETTQAILSSSFLSLLSSSPGAKKVKALHCVKRLVPTSSATFIF